MKWSYKDSESHNTRGNTTMTEVRGRLYQGRNVVRLYTECTCVPVVKCETNKNVEVTLQHLVAAHKAADLTLAVFYQPSHLRGGRRSGAENNYAKIQLRPLRFLRVPGTNTPHSYHTLNNVDTSLSCKGPSQETDGYSGYMTLHPRWVNSAFMANELFS